MAPRGTLGKLRLLPPTRPSPMRRSWATWASTSDWLIPTSLSTQCPSTTTTAWTYTLTKGNIGKNKPTRTEAIFDLIFQISLERSDSVGGGIPRGFGEGSPLPHPHGGRVHGRRCRRILLGTNVQEGRILHINLPLVRRGGHEIQHNTHCVFTGKVVNVSRTSLKCNIFTIVWHFSFESILFPVPLNVALLTPYFS